MKSRFLENYEIVKLKFAFSKDQWLPYAVCLETGLRIGDVAKIRPSDIDDDGVLHFVAQKTGKEGSVKLSSELACKLKSKRGKWCFPSPRTDGHITRQALWWRFKKACRECNIELHGASPHALRKSFSVDLYTRKGAAAVMSALQHSNIHTTELYALSDFLAEKNKDIVLTRADIPLLVEKITSFVVALISEST